MRWPLGYKPPKYASNDLCALARDAVELLSAAVECAIENSWQVGGSALLRLMVLEATLFIDVLRLLIEGHKRGNNRAAFALQRSLFEYLYRSAAFRLGLVDPDATWSASVHRIAEDERQAGGGVRSSIVDAQYNEWKARQQTGRPSERSFESLLKELFDMTSPEDEKYIYQRYRRPGIFAHGALGAIDDVFMPRQGFDSLADTALTIDPDAQLIAVSKLTHQFCKLFSDAFELKMNQQTDAFESRIKATEIKHTKRRKHA